MVRWQAISRWLLDIAMVLCGVSGGLLQAGMTGLAISAGNSSVASSEMRMDGSVWGALAFGGVAAIGACLVVVERRTALLLLSIGMVGSELCEWHTGPLILMALAILFTILAWLAPEAGTPG